MNSYKNTFEAATLVLDYFKDELNVGRSPGRGLPNFAHNLWKMYARSSREVMRSLRELIIQLKADIAGIAVFRLALVITIQFLTTFGLIDQQDAIHGLRRP